MAPGFAYYGHHKCGSLWIVRILDEIGKRLGIPGIIQDHAIAFPGGPPVGPGRGEAPFFLACWNTDYNYVRGLPCPAFHVIRDPRDVVVSAYFSHLYSHDDTHWPRLRAYRPYLRTLDEADGLIAEMEFSAPYLYDMLSWDYENPAIRECRFEDLIADPPARFAEILAHLGVAPGRLSDSDLPAILEPFSFERLSGRAPGIEDTHHHFRKGVPGDWKNHFSPAHVARFKALYNPLLLKTGYERSEAWAA